MMRGQPQEQLGEIEEALDALTMAARLFAHRETVLDACGFRPHEGSPAASQ